MSFGKGKENLPKSYFIDWLDCSFECREMRGAKQARVKEETRHLISLLLVLIT